MEFGALLQLETVQKIIINTLLVSIPEELFLVMFILIMLGEFEYWKEDECKKIINNWDYSRILIPTIVAALLSNILRYTIVDFDISTPVSIIVFYILIILTNDIFGDASCAKWMGKAFIFLIFGSLIMFVIEFSYIPFVLYSSGKSINEINNDVMLNFVVSIPSRLIEFIIIAVFIIKKRTLMKAKIIGLIFENRILATFTIVIAIFSFSIALLMAKLIGYEKVLGNITPSLRFIIIIGICIFPIINISGLVWCVYYVENRAFQKQKVTRDKLNNILNNVKICTANDNYDTIKWKLNEIVMDIEDVSNNLYKVGKNEL